jgi:hypothetical protein
MAMSYFKWWGDHTQKQQDDNKRWQDDNKRRQLARYAEWEAAPKRQRQRDAEREVERADFEFMSNLAPDTHDLRYQYVQTSREHTRGSHETLQRDRLPDVLQRVLQGIGTGNVLFDDLRALGCSVDERADYYSCLKKLQHPPQNEICYAVREANGVFRRVLQGIKTGNVLFDDLRALGCSVDERVNYYSRLKKLPDPTQKAICYAVREANTKAALGRVIRAIREQHGVDTNDLQCLGCDAKKDVNYSETLQNKYRNAANPTQQEICSAVHFANTH